MQHISSTPFGRRPVTAGLLAAHALAEAAQTCPPVNKWQILRDLALARKDLQLTDRDLSVLSALISFWREDDLPSHGAIVFPSNSSLSQRALGMAESTLRRHLAALVKAGLILRHDSPNGKRYAVRGQGGINRAFGFDLSPLSRRAAEITSMAQATALANDRLRRLRETIVLRLRDCEKLAAYGTAQLAEPLPDQWPALSDAVQLTKRMLRRKLNLAQLETLELHVDELCACVKAALIPQKSAESSGNAGQNERHIQCSNINSIDVESAEDKTTAKSDAAADTADQPQDLTAEPGLPLQLVLQACPEISVYASTPIRTWHDMVKTAAFVRGMAGITLDAWEEAMFHMGPTAAAISVAAILQNFSRINNPGGYLRALSRKAQQGEFTPGPMVMALLRAANARAV